MANDADRKLAHELREKRAREWGIIDGLVAENNTWRTVRHRALAAIQGREQSLATGAIRYAT